MYIRSMLPEDLEHVVAIYAEGLVTGQATFETSVPSPEAWEATHLPSCKLVAVDEDTVIGWAALSAVSNRCVYGGVAEASTYVAADRRGQGVGGALLDALITASEDEGYWTLQASTFPENESSLLLLQSRRFRIVGNRIRIGQHEGHWRDTVLLERRSTRVGV
ncbi:MAG: GNAT family N-acetyltransferase [Gammaproteobacteria bacterium]|nr:GNAT family N-acetyltransferase [Gammaproteobacteria bacterium]